MIDLPSPATILWSIVFGSLGLGYFMYGKKQAAVMPMVCGVALMVYTYFVSNNILIVVIGVVLAALPYFIRF